MQQTNTTTGKVLSLASAQKKYGAMDGGFNHTNDPFKASMKGITKCTPDEAAKSFEETRKYVSEWRKKKGIIV